MKDHSNILTNKHKKNQSKGQRKENSRKRKRNQFRHAASTRHLTIIYPKDKFNLSDYKAMLHSPLNKQAKPIDNIYDLSLPKNSQLQNNQKELKHFNFDCDHNAPTNILENFLEGREEREERERKERLIKFNSYMTRLQKEGIEQRNAGNYDRAIKTFEKIIELAPKNITGYNSRGYTNICRKRYHDAMKDFKICMEISPYNKTVLLNKAVTHIGLGEFKDAMKDYDNLICLFPDDSRAYNGKGVCLRRLGLYESSLQFFTKAIELGSYPSEPRLNRGLVNAVLNKPEKSIIDFNYLFKSFAYNPSSQRYLRVLRDSSVNQIKRNSFFPQNSTHGWGW